MQCTKCDRNMILCICPDGDERLRKAGSVIANINDILVARKALEPLRDRPLSYIIQTDGKIVPYFPKNGVAFTMEECYFAIKEAGKDYDPFMQVVPLPAGLIMICEENAIILNLTSNLTATMNLQGLVCMGPEGIQGPVLVCRNDMLE